MLKAPPDLLATERPSPDVHAEMLEALVAGEGLERVAAIAAAHAGAPVRILVPRPGSDGTDGDAAERYVANRLARIEKLTGLDPVRSYDRELLSLALKAHYVAVSRKAIRASAAATARRSAFGSPATERPDRRARSRH